MNHRGPDKWKIPDANCDVSNNGGCVQKRIRNNKFTHISVETINNFE